LSELALFEDCPQEERQRFLQKAWELLRAQAKKYNGLDSTSMTEERVRDLLESILFSLAVLAEKDGLSAQAMSERDFSQLLVQGQTLLEEKRKAAQTQWSRICLEAPNFGNVFFNETIKSVGGFFKLYDVYYQAHQIPCSIDYPLMKSVPESMKGVCYIERYLECISLEVRFLNRIGAENVLAFFQKSVPDYRESYMNLCENVFTNLLGKALLGHGLEPIAMSEEENKQLWEMFLGKEEDEVMRILKVSAPAWLNQLGYNRDEQEYFSEIIESIAFRINHLNCAEALSNVFLP